MMAGCGWGFFCEQKRAYEVLRRFEGSEMCLRDWFGSGGSGGSGSVVEVVAVVVVAVVGVGDETLRWLLCSVWQ